jgi:hypothetical protein
LARYGAGGEISFHSKRPPFKTSTEKKPAVEASDAAAASTTTKETRRRVKHSLGGDGFLLIQYFSRKMIAVFNPEEILGSFKN